MEEQAFSETDIQQNKALAAAGYIVFFIPLIWCRESPLGRFCANQGLLAMIAHALIGLLFSILGGIPLIGWLFVLIGHLISFAVLVISLLCAAQLLTSDRAVPLPFIGMIRLIQEQ